jgi:hypothetical protein
MTCANRWLRPGVPLIHVGRLARNLYEVVWPAAV